MDYAYILEYGPEGTMARFDYVPIIEQTLIARVTHGLATDEEIASIPASQTLVFREPFGIGRVPAAFGYLSRFMHVSSKIKNYIEALEPSVHRFFPVRLRSSFPLPGLSEHEPYYILMPPPVVDCIAVEKTRFARGFGLAGWEKGLGGSGGGGLDGTGPCVLRRQRVIGKHIWRVKVGKLHYLMVSAEFWNGVWREPQSLGVYMKCTFTD